MPAGFQVFDGASTEVFSITDRTGRILGWVDTQPGSGLAVSGNVQHGGLVTGAPFFVPHYPDFSQITSGVLDVWFSGDRMFWQGKFYAGRPSPSYPSVRLLYGVY